MNKKANTLNKRGRDDLTNLNKNNQKSRDEIINFVGDTAGLSNEQIIYKSYKFNTPNKLGIDTLARFVWSGG